jgi:hypothetical protein
MRLAILNDLSGTVDSMSAALGEVGAINRTEIAIGIEEKATIAAVGVRALPDDLSGIVDSMGDALGEVGVINCAKVASAIAQKAVRVAVGV